MCVLVVVGLCLVGGVVWIYSSSPAPGQSALNQGEGVCFVTCSAADCARMGTVGGR